MRTLLVTGGLASVVLATVIALAFTTTGCCSPDPADGMPCACAPGEPNC
jgi:hypothetical protein